jgi:quinoprotein glucose dehydrogenase
MVAFDRVNANTGEIAWQTTLGVNGAAEADRMSAAAGAGPTVTAGGLVFVGHRRSSFPRIDSKTGRELWGHRAFGAAGNANPMTYQAKTESKDVAIVAGNKVVVFALP